MMNTHKNTRLLLSTASVSLAGLIVATGCVASYIDMHNNPLGVWILMASAGIGAAIGGAATSGLYGRSGWPGWLFAIIGFVCATLLGSMIASVLFFGLAPFLHNAAIGTFGFPAIMQEVLVLGGVGILILFTEAPLYLAFWVICIPVIHVIHRKTRP